MKLHKWNSRLPRGYRDALSVLGFFGLRAMVIGLAAWKAVEILAGWLA